MDNTPINLENILEQAPKWTFAGDFTLLQWMNQISQNLETRATKTTEALDKLNNNVRSTDIALGNVANSLTTLQFGNQFVECRVQDDDETIMNVNEASSDGHNQTEHTPSSKELLNTFLENNLKALRNCHEKYSIDLDDSDEDDEGKSKEKTCIYQPINPYNEKPIPFIFGSKDWHAKWHVGLYENQEENSYSGDDISEAFSDSSSTSHLDDNESFESNTEWASSFSIDNDNLNTNIEVKNASSLRGSQSLYPGAKSVPINAAKSKATFSESSSLSTPSSSLAKKSTHSSKLQNEIVIQRSESVNSINSKNSSRTTTKENKDNSLQYKIQPQKYVDLFAEPPEDLGSITSSSSSSVQNKIPSQVNIRTISTERTSSTFRIQPPPFVDLFAEPPEDILSSTTSSISSGQQIKRKTVNLFDNDDQDDVVKDDLLSVLTKKDEMVKPKNEGTKNLSPIKTMVIDKPLNITKTPKSLFEDSDEEDDDFLKAFVKKSSKEAVKTSLTKTLLFDNEFSEDSLNKKRIPTEKDNSLKNLNNKKQNIFIDTEGNQDDDVLVSKTTKDESKTSIIAEDNKSAEKENTTKTLNLFDDLKNHNLQPKEKPKKKNLFDDLDDDVGDIFYVKPKQSSKDQTIIGDITTENILGENVTKTIEVDTKKENKNVTRVINSEEPTNNSVASIDNLQDKLTKTSKELNKSSENQENIYQNVSINKVLKVTEYEDIVINKNPLSNENKDLTDAMQVKIDEKLALNNTFGTESQLESSNYDKTTLDKKELNNNVTISITQEKTVPISTNQTQKPSAINKYDFNSILFLDEPPEDDNAFFETLTKTQQTLNSNYNAIDLENDIYEPELPKVPGASTINNQTDATENKQTNSYTGLQLFSDIPPDDDNNASNTPADVNETKRLHSVFYDDFNETLMALNKNQLDKQIPKHSIFSDEPPPINEELNSSSEDAIDHKVPDSKADVTKEDYKLEGSKIETIVEESLSKSDNKNDTILNFKRPASKLQIPHININVQALLPGASNTLGKVKEDNAKTKAIDKVYDEEKKHNISVRDIAEKETTVLQKRTVEVHRTAETEHILPSVTKNRVRAPAARRPSTRRARQENYRKSLIEEQKTLESDDGSKGIQNENRDLLKPIKTNIPKNLLMQEEQKNNKGVNKEQANVKPIERNPIKPLSSMLFEDKTHDNSNIFDVNKSINVEVETDSEMLKEETPKHMEGSSSKKDKSDIFKQVKSNSETHKNLEIKRKTAEKKTSSIFDDEEEDFDLFKHIKTSKTNDNKATTQVIENEAKEPTTIFKQYDENNSINNTKIQVTKEIPDAFLPATSATLLKLDSTQQQSLKADDNIFIKSQDNATFKPNQIKTITEISNQSSINKVKSSFLDDDEYDNDLFQTTIQKPIASNRSRESNIKEKSQFKSFLDSESEEDIKVAGLSTTSSKYTNTASSTKAPIVSAPTQKNTTAKLFTDSDTDSDDLFGKLTSTKSSNNKISNESSTTTQNKTQLQISLFSDESDGEDFLKSSGKVIKNIVSKSTSKENKSKMTDQTNVSLFSDIDSDEDDLFGSGAAKVSTKNATNISNVKVPSTSKPSITPTAEISKPKTVVADNPLADLL